MSYIDAGVKIQSNYGSFAGLYGDEVKQLAFEALMDCLEENDVVDRMQLKTRVKDEVSKFLYSKTKRKPMVLPVIMNA